MAAAALQRFSGRQAVACVCLLTMIVAGTAAVAWWSWETLQDRRLELGAQAHTEDVRSDSRALTRDLVARRDTGTATQAPESRPLSANLERATGSVRAVDPTSITVDGRAVAVVVITAALGAATAASASVVRRYRRRTDRPPSVARRAATDGQEAAEAGVEGEADATRAVEAEVEEVDAGVDVEAGAGEVVEGEGDGPERAQVDVPGQVAAEPAEHGSLAVEQASLRAGLVPQRQPEGDEDLSGRAPRALAPQGGGAPAGVAAAGPPPEPSTFAVPSDVAARQRLYDRRRSRSVPYVHPAWLWWAEDNAPATVQDLSLTGLRCLVAVTADAGAAQGPALGAEARMFFPLDGSTMKVNARVQWREHTADGMEVGLEFVGLPHDDSAALERLLLSMA